MADILLKEFLSDNERFADVINGLGCDGRPFIKPENLTELDSQTGLWRDGIIHNRKGKNSHKRRKKSKYRDLIRKACLGTNYIIIGIENQEYVDYLLPVRTMSYDAGEYERQAKIIRRKNRKDKRKLTNSEFLSGFRKVDRLDPVVTFILYYGDEEYDGAKDIYQLLNSKELPESLKKYIRNYEINVIEIRKLEDTSVFHTDVKQVFDFIRYSKDREKLQHIVEEQPEYTYLEEDAYDVIAEYANVEGLLELKESHMKGDKIDMCQALREWMEDSKAEGKAEAILEVLSELGDVDLNVKTLILEQTDLTVLSTWVKKAARADSVQQFIDETGIAV